MVVEEKLNKTYDMYLEMRKDHLDNIYNLYRDDILSNGVIFCGVGKNWYIAEELTKLFISFGLNAQALDCTHALHGDCGMIKDQVLFFLSKSGTTKELVTLMNYLKTVDHFSNNKQILVSLRDVKSDTADYIIKPKTNYIYEFDSNDLIPTLSLTTILLLLSEFGVRIFESDETLVKLYKHNHPGGEIVERLSCK